MVIILMLAGVGFFYGSYSFVGKFIEDTEENPDKAILCDKFISANASKCL
jgi:hypothetical protein